MYCIYYGTLGISLVLFISATNRNDRLIPLQWRAESRDPVPRWRVWNKSSASGHESHLVFTRIFTLLILLTVMWTLFPWAFLPFFFVEASCFFAPQGTSGTAVELWSLSWTCTLHIVQLHRTFFPLLHWFWTLCGWSEMWSRSVPLQRSRHRNYWLNCGHVRCPLRRPILYVHCRFVWKGSTWAWIIF